MLQPPDEQMPARLETDQALGSTMDAEYVLLRTERAGVRLRLQQLWWAVGPYLAYCSILWGAAALIGWLSVKH